MDVTRLPGPGLNQAQEERLQVLERSTRITGMQAGEAQFYALQGTREQRERAQAVVARGAAKRDARAEGREAQGQDPIAQIAARILQDRARGAAK
jgi:hypothetical protein